MGARDGCAQPRAALEARGDLDGAREALDRALAEHARMYCPFERGRTLFAPGSIRRRAREKRAAREALEEAHQIFDGLGAGLWVGRASDELARISGRRAATTDLTTTEATLAALAAEGLSNKEIASTLHISVHTVEATSPASIASSATAPAPPSPDACGLPSDPDREVEGVGVGEFRRGD